MHWLYGGVYERADQLAVIEDLPRSLSVMPVLHRFGHVAVSGCAFWRSEKGVADAEAPLMVTHFNTQRLVRMPLRVLGSTFVAEEQEFLKLHDAGVHLTDVMEDPRDGSLLLINTGGWFRNGCPSSLVAKPDELGAVYRIRAVRRAPVERVQAEWVELNAERVLGALESGDLAAKRRALDWLNEYVEEDAVVPDGLQAAVRDLIGGDLDAPLEHALITFCRRHGVIGSSYVLKAENLGALRHALLCFTAEDSFSLNEVVAVAGDHLDSLDASLAEVAMSVVVNHPDADEWITPRLKRWLLDADLAPHQLRALEVYVGTLIKEEGVRDLLGAMLGHGSDAARATAVGVLAGQILGSDTVGALKVVHEQSEGGKDLGRLLGDLIQYVRTLLVFQADPEAALEDLVPEVAQMVSQQAGQASAPQLLRVVDGLAEVDARMRWATKKRLHFELGVIQAVQHINEVSLDDVIRALDQGNADGVRQPVAQRAPGASPRRAPVASAPRGSAAEIRDPEEQAEGAGGLGLSAQLRQMRADQQSSGQKPAVRVATPAAAAEAPVVEAKSAGDQGGSPQAAMIPGIDRMEVFWPEFVQAVTKARPLISNWVQVARCLELTRREARLGFALRDHAAADQLRKPDMLHFLEATAEGLVGHPMRISLEVDADLVRPSDAEIDALLAPRSARVSVVEQEVAGEGESAEAELDKASGAEPVAAEAEVEDSVDPLIKKAVEIFRLKHFPDEGTSE
jgi:hypothetical protein